MNPICLQPHHHAWRQRALRLAVWATAAGMGLGGANMAAAQDVSVSKPVGELFAPNGAKLSAAGEQWLRAQVAGHARQPDHLVVVQVAGATEALQAERARAIRQRLAALGVAPQNVYVEAAPTEPPASRMAGL